MKNRDGNADYTQLQVKAFLELFAVAGYALLTMIVVSALRFYGVGGNFPLYLGLIMLLFGSVLVVIYGLSRKYTRPFRCIDQQLNALLLDESSEIQLPKGLASMEQKLNALKQAMERRLFSAQLAEQQKNDLVMYLAHDIRTPLTSIIGYLSLLDEAGDMPEEQRKKYTRISLDKAYQLEKMMDEFFEIARYSLQQIRLNRENVDLCCMLVQLTDELLPVLSKNGNAAVIQMENEDLFVYGDGEKLARVFNNVLKNAAAYSNPNTEIVIATREHGGMVDISIRNRGKSIPPEKLDRLFDKFYRLEESRNSGAAGTGLGLAIAKEIITLHGGTIRAESENDTVTILITLPAGKKQA